MTDSPAPPSAPELPPSPEEPPPFLGSWRNVYLLVLGTLALAIVLFTLFTRAYR